VDIDKGKMREKLKEVGAKLIRPEFMQKRIILDPAPGYEIKGGFLRVRDEGDKITLTLKVVDGENISDQKEIITEVKDFDATVLLLKTIGCIPMAYEETKRELWNFENADITIDDWPFLGVILEVEGKSEEDVKRISEKLGFDYSVAKFCTAGTLYKEKYGVGPTSLFKKTGKFTELTFTGKNPFIE
jgi:adenylate cyclase, class 2